MKSFLLFFFVACFSTAAFAVNCAGTEPFWGAQILTDKIVLEGPGYEVPMALPVTSVSGASGLTADFLKVYSNDNGQVAVITSNKCTDGMSDYEFPNEIIIFTGTETLYGCCGEGVATGEGI